MARKVIQMTQTYEAIESRHANKWIVIRVVDAQKHRGEFVYKADEFSAPELWEASRREHAKG
ncbi:MAG: hypothetical protein M0Z36_06290, partial [Thermaerobacter sp.]|nr:hypothetical protein [Thermaerobacter sp.]